MPFPKTTSRGVVMPAEEAICNNFHNFKQNNNLSCAIKRSHDSIVPYSQSAFSQLFEKLWVWTQKKKCKDFALVDMCFKCKVPAGIRTWVDSTRRVRSQRSNRVSKRVRPASERFAGRLGCHIISENHRNHKCWKSSTVGSLVRHDG